MYKQIAANKRKTVILMFLFMGLVTGLVWLFSTIFLDYPLATPYILVGAGIYVAISYFSGSKLALMANGAKAITKKDNPRLWRIVENLSITNGMLMPKVYIMNDPGLNAFATGRNPSHSAVAVTSGLLEACEDSELEGVIAHELGHIKNYDIRVSLMAFALVAVIGLLADAMMHFLWFGDDDDSSSSVFMAVGIVGAILAPIVASLIQLAISRRREYLADATGALTTRYPEGLAAALEKIKLQGSVTSHQNSSTAHLFFANPLKGKNLSALFSTHPPIDDRIRILREMDLS